MDRFLRMMATRKDGELMVGDHAAYQVDRSNLIAYDAAYYDKCSSYEGKEIARKINQGRVALVNYHFGTGQVCDVGIGSGEFIKNRPNTYGVDVNPVAIEWLKRNDLWAEKIEWFEAVTMWDVLEHLPDPEDVLGRVRKWLFISVPIVDMTKIRESKHYRPNEHLLYFTELGLVSWLGRHGFTMIDRQTFEIEAGRDSIYSYAFRR